MEPIIQEFNNSVRTSQETNYVPATKTIQLMSFRWSILCIFWEPYQTHITIFWIKSVFARIKVDGTNRKSNSIPVTGRGGL
jgi:hypothetical protein